MSEKISLDSSVFRSIKQIITIYGLLGRNHPVVKKLAIVLGRFSYGYCFRDCFSVRCRVSAVFALRKQKISNLISVGC